MRQFIIILIAFILSSCATLEQDLFKDSDTLVAGINQRGFEDVYVHFAHNSFVIAPDQFEQVAAIAEAIPQLLTAEKNAILLIGHTDTTGTVAYNDQLSRKRAKSVKTMLVNKFSVPKKTLFFEGRGETELLRMPEETIDDRRINRRVQLILTSTDEAIQIKKQIAEGRNARLEYEEETKHIRIARKEYEKSAICEEGDCEDGYGRKRYPDGHTLKGNWVDGLPNGKIVYVSPSGSKYTRHWLNGVDVTKAVKNCRTAGKVVTGYQSFTAGVSVLLGLINNASMEEITETAYYGYQLAGKQAIPLAVKIYCSQY